MFYFNVDVVRNLTMVQWKDYSRIARKTCWSPSGIHLKNMQGK